MNFGLTPAQDFNTVNLMPRWFYDELDASYPVKAQYVRLLDVFLFGPVMIYAALYPNNMNATTRWALGIIGAGTILYNGMNYLEIERRKQAAFYDPNVMY